MSCQIIIEKSPTLVAPGKRHFNMRGSPVVGRDVWDVKKLLEVNVLSESLITLDEKVCGWILNVC